MDHPDSRIEDRQPNEQEYADRYGNVRDSSGVLAPRALWAESDVPKYEVDQSWPKPFPDRWVVGGLGGVCVDRQDHVFLLNRQDVPEIDLNPGHLAPATIEIDNEGNLVNS